MDGGTTPATQTHADERPSRTTLTVCALAWSLWIGGLMILAISDSGPSPLNQRQLRQSSVILAGVVLDRETGEIKVTEVFRGDPGGDTVLVVNLHETNAERGGAYLFPLRALSPSGRFIVTPAEAITPDGRLLEYPDLLALPGRELVAMSDELKARRLLPWLEAPLPAER